MRRLTVLLCCAALSACATRPAATVQQAPRVALPPAPPPGEPGDLAGLQSTALRAAFGAPSFVRKDGNVEIWRYDGANCKAFFFLYPYGNALLVRHVETLPRGSSMAADETCLSSFRPHSQQSVS
ncbi:MAG TPA: hypothetical protein VMF67_10315 [Rhizomicrobium sp.]|nr:hypothetical protein [Rhizomicrobium sp.]